jgi:hypothetical protein
MKFPRLITAISLSILAFSAHAQFGNLLNQLQKEVEKELSKSANSALGSSQSNPSSFSYCNRLKDNVNLNQIAAKLTAWNEKYPNESAVFFNDTSPNKQYYDWAETQLLQDLKIRTGVAFESDRIPNLNAEINTCLQSIQDSNLKTVLTDRYNSRKMEFKTSRPNVFDSFNKRQMFLISFALNGSSEKLEEYSKALDEKITIEEKKVQEYKAAQAKKAAEDEKNRLIQEKAEKEQAEEDRKYREFLATPDGKLYYAYRNFQVLSVCQESNLMVFGEYQNQQARMKSIEALMKPHLKAKNTEQIWQDAEKANRKSVIGFAEVDLFEHIRFKRRSDFLGASEDCKSVLNNFAAHANSILGP